MIPPSVSHTVPATGQTVEHGRLQIHGHTLHILDDDALEVVCRTSGEPLNCPVTMETFDEGDLDSELPGSFQVRCVMTIDVSDLKSGGYELRLNLLSQIYTSVFRLN